MQMVKIIDDDGRVMYDGPIEIDRWIDKPPEAGHLYVLQFDSGWVKVGRSTRPARRVAELRRQYRREQGWELTDKWVSGPLSNIRDPSSYRYQDLIVEEFRLLRGVEVMSDGRKITGNGHAETFHGCDFGTVVAYADVIARCSRSGADRQVW